MVVPFLILISFSRPRTRDGRKREKRRRPEEGGPPDRGSVSTQNMKIAPLEGGAEVRIGNWVLERMGALLFIFSLRQPKLKGYTTVPGRKKMSKSSNSANNNIAKNTNKKTLDVERGLVSNQGEEVCETYFLVLGLVFWSHLL